MCGPIVVMDGVERIVCMQVIESQTTNKKQSRKKRSQRIIKTQLDTTLALYLKAC